MSDPCDNGGTCTDTLNGQSGFICQCPEDYSRAMCDVDEDFCTSETCQNDGSYMRRREWNRNRVCMCAEGFSGPNCTTDLSIDNKLLSMISASVLQQVPRAAEARGLRGCSPLQELEKGGLSPPSQQNVHCLYKGSSLIYQPFKTYF